jgi:ketosteroid isomerase-like protein
VLPTRDEGEIVVTCRTRTSTTRVIQATSRRDVDGACATLADDSRLFMPMEAPSPGAHEGQASIRRFFEGLFARWAEFVIEVDELIPHEEAVVALVRFRGKGRMTGMDFSQEAAFRCTFEDGRIKTLALFADRAEARRAAGRPSASV